MESYLFEYNVELKINFDNNHDPIISLSTIILKDSRIENKDITNNLLNQINYKSNNISFYNKNTDIYKLYKSKNVNGFTDGELFDCILNFEQLSRPYTDWIGQIDRTHIYFEEIRRTKCINGPNIFEICWDSVQWWH